MSGNRGGEKARSRKKKEEFVAEIREMKAGTGGSGKKRTKEREVNTSRMVL